MAAAVSLQSRVLSGQKNKENWHSALLKSYFWASWGRGKGLLLLCTPGYAI